MYPAYADALDAWAGPSRAKDALSMGRRALSNDPEVTAKVIARLPDSDKEFFKAGVARALKDKIDSAQDGADATRRIFGNDLIRSKIQAAFNDPAAFADFENTMQREAAFARTRNEVLRGSQTARRLAGQQDTGVDVTTPLFHTVTGNFGHAAMNVFQQAAEAMKRPPGKQGVELGNMLFSPGANAGTLDALATVRANPLLRSYLARAGILGGVNMLAPSAGQ